MDARNEIENLKKEFVTLKTEEERKAFDVKFRNHIQAKTEDGMREFADAFAEAARTDARRIKQFCNETTIRVKLEEILGIVSMAYVARHYFHKSKFWFSQKLNGNLKNGAPSTFTEDELKTLAFALEDISVKLHHTARSIA
jgi:hypothetical protein